MTSVDVVGGSPSKKLTIVQPVIDSSTSVQPHVSSMLPTVLLQYVSKFWHFCYYLVIEISLNFFSQS